MKTLLLSLLLALPALCLAQSDIIPLFKLRSDGTINTGFTLPSGMTITFASGSNVINNGTATGFGAGTVTSVGLSLPPIFGTGSPVTTSGNLTASLATQAAHTLLIGPTTGADAAPTFRLLVAADLPDLSAVYSPLAGSSSLTTFSGGTFGGAASLAASVGGGGTFDNGKVAAFSTGGYLNAAYFAAIVSGSSNVVSMRPTSIVFFNGTHQITLAASISGSADYTSTFPAANGTVINTGNLTSITATGTVTSGTWSGSFGAVSGANLTTLNASNLSSGTVATARLGTGTASSSTALFGDNTWQTISSGLTIGTTVISGGTAGRVLYEKSDHSVAEISGATSDGTTLTLTAPVLGTPASGTLTNCTGLPPAGVVGTASILGANTFTDTQTIVKTSGLSDTTPNLQLVGYGANLSVWYDYVGGSLGTTINSGNIKSGSVSAGSDTVALDGPHNAIGLAQNNRIYWSDNSSVFYTTVTLSITQDAPATLQLGADDVTPVSQAIKAHDATGTDHAAADLRLEGGQSTGTGAAGKVILRTADVGTTGSSLNTYSDRMTVDTGITTHAQPVKLAIYTFGNLPSAVTVGAAAMAWVTDATDTTPYTIVVGGGVYQVLVISDGSSWIIH